MTVRHPRPASERPSLAPAGRLRSAALVAALALFVAACQHEGESGPFVSGPQTPAEGTATKHMIVAGHPLAAEAGREILRAGGSAVDAAIAAEMVLTLVEPQSSGIGGGGFLLHYAAKRGAIDAYDGRETAPKSAHPYMFLDGTGKPRDRRKAGVGGLGVGVPGLLRMLELAHKDHGRLPWKDLFRPAIRLASDGFPVSERLAAQIARTKSLKDDPEARAYFFDDQGAPKTAGTVLVNTILAETLGRVAAEGADAFYTGAIADAVAKAVREAKHNPAGMKAADLATYRARKRAPVCAPYRVWLVCGMGPPSSGGIATLQILGILQNFELPKLDPESAEAAHLMAEAGKLAFADRDVYIADPDFVPVPAAGLIDPSYLALRAKEIDIKKAGPAYRQPGMPRAGARLFAPAGDGGLGQSTTHLSVVDQDGNALAMTVSNAWTFGSRLMAAGFILNNQLTDFAFEPNRSGAQVANRAAAGKRPLSSMAPTLAFGADGGPVVALGSPGGSRIIGYVVKALIAALDWKMAMQSAVDLPNVLARAGPVEIEVGTPLVKLKPALEKMGHEVRLFSFPSGLNGIRVTENGLEGGADSRREGVALGD